MSPPMLGSLAKSQGLQAKDKQKERKKGKCCMRLRRCFANKRRRFRFCPSDNPPIRLNVARDLWIADELAYAVAQRPSSLQGEVELKLLRDVE